MQHLKVITRLWFLRLAIDRKIWLLFFNQWDAKPKPIAANASDFSRPFSKLQAIVRSSDCFITLFAPVVTGSSNSNNYWFFDSNLKFTLMIGTHHFMEDIHCYHILCTYIVSLFLAPSIFCSKLIKIKSITTLFKVVNTLSYKTLLILPKNPNLFTLCTNWRLTFSFP